MGYGSVYKLSGNRRKPWVAMLTKGWLLVDGKAQRQRSAIGYYATRKEAEIALANYNQNPYDTDVTFAEVYKRWSKQKYPTLSDGAVENYEYAYKYLMGEMSLAEAKEQCFYRDWHLARRQMTWFARNPEINWMALSKILPFVIKCIQNE